jgi:hypothetical protein
LLKKNQIRNSKNYNGRISQNPRLSTSVPFF